MSLARGPLRIVLLRSGVYDYAELELHEPVHLVASNNVGKTSLISALQFLYIDDARQMHFSHGWAETRRHYFPESGSLMLFECMTPTGLQVFGLRGLGPVQGFEYQRFAYAGAYEREDFLDERRPRPWDEVARRLIGRELRAMEPRHLRAALTAGGDAGGAPLGLVPLKRSGSYESFRFLFKNLLRLSRIEQDQLKRLFLDIARPQLRRTEVDLRKDYTELFQRVDGQAREIAALRIVAPSIAELVALWGEREGTRGRLAAQWRAIEAALEAERARVEALKREIHDERAALGADEERLKEEQAAALAEGHRLSKEAGGLEHRHQELETLRDFAATFVPEFETANRGRLQQRYDDLTARLQAAGEADRTRVERELAEVRRRLDADLRLVERFGDAVVTRLRERSGLADDALADVFGVLDASLLGEVIDEGRVRVLDEAAALALVRRVHGAFDGEGLALEGLRIRRPPPEHPSPLAGYEDVEAVQARIAEIRADEARLARLLRDALAREELLTERAQVAEELAAARERLDAFETWTRRRCELDEVTADLTDLRVRTEANVKEVQVIGDRLKTVALALNERERRSLEVRTAFERQASDVTRLTPAPTDWVPTTDAGPLDDLGLDALVSDYRQGSRSQLDLSRRVEKLFAEILFRTADRIAGATEKETIALLEDELAALEEREKAVKDLWASLVDGLRNAFKALLDGVDEIRREVSRLTAALGRGKVSNLERIELELAPQHDLIQRLRSVVDVEEVPLFAGPEGRTRAAVDVQKWLEDRPRLDLAELFDLRFKVIDARGQPKSFDSLSQIESQGTSTTIKVLVHLELLRSMLSDNDVAVPFFLDEVATLDAPNLRALIEHASQMGFVPVVASPEARDCVDTLYFLRPPGPGRDRLVLDETSRLRRHREPADAP